MTFSRLQRRVAALAAILAISLQAFWPLIAQAQPRVSGELVPICSVNGVTHYLELPATKTPLEQRSATHGEHCKLCVFGAAKAGAVLPVVLSFVLSEFSSEKPARKAISIPESPERFPANPRAPPRIS